MSRESGEGRRYRPSPAERDLSLWHKPLRAVGSSGEPEGFDEPSDIGPGCSKASLPVKTHSTQNERSRAQNDGIVSASSHSFRLPNLAI